MYPIWTGYVTSDKGRVGVAVIWDQKQEGQAIVKGKLKARRRKSNIVGALRDENKELRTMNEFLRRECKVLRRKVRAGNLN